MNPSSPEWKIIDWSAPVLTIQISGETHRLVLTGSPRRPRWSWQGAFQEALQPGAASSGQMVTSGSTVSPMPGTVLEVRVKPGDSVEEGQTLVVVEAMKMEIPVKAPTAGIIGQVEVSQGDAVARGDTLVSMEEEETG
jgi:biotin carboxyl carrier protein